MARVSRRGLFKAGAALVPGIAAPEQIAPIPERVSPAASSEPNAELASLWWPEQRNVWTAIGWKDHYFRFNVVYNGTIICEPCPHFAPVRPNALRWKGQSFQLTFMPTADGTPLPLSAQQTQLWRLDGGHGIQGWDSTYATPLLWTEWRLQEGLVIRQEIFSHVASGQDVVTGIEPHYAWVRLIVTHVDELRAAAHQNFSIQLSQVYYKHVEHYKWEDGITIDVDPQAVSYINTLRLEDGTRLVEPDNKIRLIILPHSADKVKFSEVHPDSRVYGLKIQLDAKVGDLVDLLVPMLPETKEEVQKELDLGREAALAECDRYWAKTPAEVARVQIPEKHIQEVVSRSIRFAEIIAEKDYVTGDYTFLTGSWGYDNLWSTPSSMTSFMFLDLLGYFETVERHVELFRKHQGSVKPPGPSYKLHPGYFSTPRTLTAFDWLTDHGAILHQLSTHALLSANQRFIARWTEPIVKACDFIKDSCAITDHDGVPGLLPPAVATDEIIPTQAVYSLAWHYKGLRSAVRLLKRTGHGRAGEFDEFSNGFKSTFVKAFRERSVSAPQWTDASGAKRPKPPTTLSSKPMRFHPFSEAFYLDGGPMILVWAGLLPADDELMRASVAFFREGPDTQLYGYRSNPLARPILMHEISTCEPCYSWNIFHSWQLADRARFLEGLYSLFLGSLSKQTYIAAEHRHGIQCTQCATYLAFNLARLSVIDDEIVEGELHLLRLCPAAWLTSTSDSVFEKMPTLYGVVNLRFRLSDDRKTLSVFFNAEWREKPAKITLHAPSPGLTHIIVNGKRQPARTEILI
ncbi:MAG TPA: hypothetical protein VH369_21440 [Bryobacteraceae bacterium]|jgi:hypothetical protein